MASICYCRLGWNNKVTRNNLAMTPAQVYDSYKKGIPISLSTLSESSFIEQSNDNDFSVPLEYKRGADMNTCFEYELDMKKRLKEDGFSLKDF